MTRVKNKFKNANEVFNYFYPLIKKQGIDFGDTKALFNIGFWIDKPSEMDITHPDRKWNKEYAEAEWQWYLTEDPSIDRLGDIYGKVPPIWERMADPQGNVNSNYGYQWQRGQNHMTQLDYIIDILNKNGYYYRRDLDNLICLSY